MRLLYIDNSGKVSLTRELLAKDEVPPYAILSHTWGDEEVTFDDLAKVERDEKKAGWNKIRFCMQQAAKDGLKYSWVDTCCIKKDDATELQYSINSMFRWYKEAAKCYVYLTDVSSTVSNRNRHNQTNLWLEAFEQSRWFTRGWTLQELLAPCHLEFFSKEGEMLGTREDMRESVQIITRLPLSALSGADFHNFEIEERLSWTANRQTKREEDKAYSLLGILNIFMPLIYGEGEENAFRRLRNEIKDRKYNTIASTRFSEDDFNCLKSLSFFEQANRYHDIHAARGTCDWLLKYPAFQKWMNSSCGLFWVKGNPGVGKSVLMKYAVDSLQRSGEAGLVLSYFVHGQGTELQKSPLGVSRAILNDLLRQFPDQLKSLTRKFVDRNERLGSHAGSWAWSQNELEGVLESLLTEQKENPAITIFIDALDELGNDSARHVLNFVRTLTTALREKNRRARFCVSSRHYPIIGHEDIPHVNVEQENSGDIAWYIRKRIQEIEPVATREDIERQLLSKSQGAFQWVYLVTESIIEDYLIGMSHKALLLHIASCPENLGELYGALFETAPKRYKRRSLALLQWVLYAKRPLTAGALRDALVVSTNERLKTFTELTADPGWSDTIATFDRHTKYLSKGLIRLQEPISRGWRSEVQLVHQSVADYLLDKNLDRIGTSDAQAAHHQLAKACLRYITYDEILDAPRLRHYWNFEHFLPQFSLAAYASDYILEHIVGAGGLASLEPGLVGRYAATRDRNHKIPLLVASERGHNEIARHLVILNPSAVETPDHTGLTAPVAALRVAWETQRFDAVSALVSLGHFSGQTSTLALLFIELCDLIRLDDHWVAKGMKEAARLLLNSGWTLDYAYDKIPLFQLIMHPSIPGLQLDTVVIYLKAEDWDGEIAMSRARKGGYGRILELLACGESTMGEQLEEVGTIDM